MVQPDAKVVDSPDRGLRDGCAKVSSEVLRSWIGEDVSVCIDEPGQHRICGEVRNRDARGRGVGDRLNAISSNEYVGVSAHFSGTHVDKFARQHGLRDRRRSWAAGRLR